jgi:hypothetical protein
LDEHLRVARAEAVYQFGVLEEEGHLIPRLRGGFRNGLTERPLHRSPGDLTRAAAALTPGCAHSGRGRKMRPALTD